MKVISEKEFIVKEDFFHNEVLKGKIFIYPTDTIYGIGCDATNAKAVLKIREIKKRDEKPFSVIAPNKKWIFENCAISRKSEWLNKLPGKYTLILKLKNKLTIARETNGGKETLGVRIPRNWFAGFVSNIGKPFITTSVNLAGEKPISSLVDLDNAIKKNVDYFVDCGTIEGSPSTIVDLTEGEKIISRA